MDKARLSMIRDHLEYNFRKGLKNDIKYNFLPSLGQKLMVQGFRNDKNEEAGFLVLQWNGKRKDYDSRWIEFEDVNLVQQIIEEHTSKQVINTDMVQMAMHFHLAKKYDHDKVEIEEEPSPTKGILLS